MTRPAQAARGIGKPRQPVQPAQPQEPSEPAPPPDGQPNVTTRIVFGMSLSTQPPRSDQVADERHERLHKRFQQWRDEIQPGQSDTGERASHEPG